MKRYAAILIMSLTLALVNTTHASDFISDSAKEYLRILSKHESQQRELSSSLNEWRDVIDQNVQSVDEVRSFLKDRNVVADENTILVLSERPELLIPFSIIDSKFLQSTRIKFNIRKNLNGKCLVFFESISCDEELLRSRSLQKESDGLGLLNIWALMHELMHVVSINIFPSFFMTSPDWFWIYLYSGTPTQYSLTNWYENFAELTTSFLLVPSYARGGRELSQFMQDRIPLNADCKDYLFNERAVSMDVDSYLRTIRANAVITDRLTYQVPRVTNTYERQTALKKLIGKSINNRDKEGNTALHTAVLMNNLDQVIDLIELGASCSIKNNDSYTPRKLARIKKLNGIKRALRSNCEKGAH